MSANMIVTGKDQMKCLTILLVLSCLPASLLAQTTALYDPSLNTLPASQGWFSYITNFQGSATQTLVTGGTQLVTTGTAQAGYFNKNPLTGTLNNASFPTLNRSNGYAIRFDVSVTSESHSNNDRAGFSIIALSSDLQGIELGFWTNEIWAQNQGFTHGEGAAINTVPNTSYLLTILGNNYSLNANGTDILTGSLRNYSGFGIPYSHTNFLFLGDDTTSANADITLGQVQLLSSIPEPATWFTMAGLGAIAITRYRRWRLVRLL
jgi:hypothetical protein